LPQQNNGFHPGQGGAVIAAKTKEDDKMGNFNNALFVGGNRSSDKAKKSNTPITRRMPHNEHGLQSSASAGQILPSNTP